MAALPFAKETATHVYVSLETFNNNSKNCHGQHLLKFSENIHINGNFVRLYSYLGLKF